MRIPSQVIPATRGDHQYAVSPNGVIPSVCVTATVQNGKACIDLPVVGKQCISVPNVPVGVKASICGDICYRVIKIPFIGKKKIPAGACATVTVAGQQVARQCFGAC